MARLIAVVVLLSACVATIATDTPAPREKRQFNPAMFSLDGFGRANIGNGGGFLRGVLPAVGRAAGQFRGGGVRVSGGDGRFSVDTQGDIGSFSVRSSDGANGAEISVSSDGPFGEGSFSLQGGDGGFSVQGGDDGGAGDGQDLGGGESSDPGDSDLGGGTSGGGYRGGNVANFIKKVSNSNWRRQVAALPTFVPGRFDNFGGTFGGSSSGFQDVTDRPRRRGSFGSHNSLVGGSIQGRGGAVHASSFGSSFGGGYRGSQPGGFGSGFARVQAASFGTPRAGGFAVQQKARGNQGYASGQVRTQNF